MMFQIPGVFYIYQIPLWSPGPLCFKLLVGYIFKSNPAVVTEVHYVANSWCVLYSNPAVVHR